jgi:hypothetical protein
MPDHLPSPEAVFAVVVLVALGAFRIIRWFQKAASSPDPWGPEVEAALQREDTLPLCPHCLAPQQQETWFCGECGNSIGKYNNLNPYLYAFSLGDLFRNATAGWVCPRPLVITGFLLLSVWVFVSQGFGSIGSVGLAFTYWALFWWLFFRNRNRIPVENAPPDIAGPAP